jgi:hypothetical protein
VTDGFPPGPPGRDASAVAGGTGAINQHVEPGAAAYANTGVHIGDVTITTVAARYRATTDLAEVADQLAQVVRTRRRDEEEQRQIHDPVPLPLRWQPVPGNLMDGWDSIRRAPVGGRCDPLPLTGHLDQIVEVYRRIPSGRLVVLGRAGSGKTTLARRFVLDVLDTRAATDAVPVIFSLGSWNPVTAGLRDWLVSQLVRDHRDLAATTGGGTRLAATLVETGRILPILDGFDEIADGLRRAALKELNTTRMPLLLTSRRTEYAAAVAETDVLTAAAGVELTDLPLTDVVDYLPRTTRRIISHGGSEVPLWDPVLRELQDHPGIPASVNLAAVLTTPLMVALARAIYSDTPDHDPFDLLKFATSEAIENHLVENFVPTVYRYRPNHQTTGHHRRWNPDRAEYWLGYLAWHLDQLDTPNLEWWRLGTTMKLRSLMVVVGVTVGLASGLVAGLVYGFEAGLVYGFASGLREAIVDAAMNGLGVGLTFGLMHGFATNMKVGGPVFEPSLMRIQFRGGTKKKLRESFLPRVGGGLAGGFLFGVLWALGGAAYLALLGYSGLVIALASGNELALGIGLGVAVGLVAALGAGFETVIKRERFARPLDLLNENRVTVLTQLLAVWLVIGSGYGITFGLANGIVPGLGAGLMVALGLGTMTAWGRWVVLARVWLPLTGRLPRDLNAFLDDAYYERGVLRQAGAVYQFRHARIQSHLSHVFQERHETRRPGSPGSADPAQGT